jgi:MFS family permease
MVGTWMQTVGAQWLLVDEPRAPTLVALVQTAAMLPTLMLALPAGALADILDRRKLLITVQLFQLSVGAILTGLAVLDRLPPAVLLGATFLLGCGATLTIPGYQALVGQLVPRELMRSASALNGVAQNTARAIGPAVAGLLIAHTGVAAVFGLNALSFAVLAVVLAATPGPGPESMMLPERFTGALTAGTRYVRNSLAVRRILLRILIFVVPAAALWALLPLVADRLLHLDATGYGLLMAALGVGAVVGAAVRPRLAARLAPNRLVLLAGLVFAASIAITALAGELVVVLIALVPAGLAWLTMLATLNGTLQVFLPRWVRARGLSIYQMFFAGGQALAALAWGVLAQWLGLVPTLLGAAGLMAAGAATIRLWPLREIGHLDRDPVVYWPEPDLHAEPDEDAGPVLVTLTYSVQADRAEEFVRAMQPVRRMRLRTGAATTTLYRDGADPTRFVEVSVYPTWGEHLRQHGGRLTGADRELEETANALADGRPGVRHLFPPPEGSRSGASPPSPPIER